MEFQTIWTIIYVVAISSLGFSLLTEEINAQAQITPKNSLDVPIEDGAIYLRDLETRSASQWSFTRSNRQETSQDYEIHLFDPEIALREHNIPEWGNTGDSHNSSVLVDIYTFTEDNHQSGERSN